MLNNEPLIRLGVFAAALLIFLLLETLFPRRERRFDRLVRWPANFMVALLDTLAVRLLFPLAGVGFAAWCQQQGYGLLNNLTLPDPAGIVLAMLVLDLAIYAQHIVFHRIPALWRIHRMHHTDLDLDATSALRFHPLEILLSMAIKMVVISALGAPPVAVLLFEILLNAGAMFNHANLRIPVSLDRIMRLLIVTPDMHRIHHSITPDETNHNFGFNLSCWDRLFKTYRENPAAGQTGMILGIAEQQSIDAQRIDRMLMQPWVEEQPSSRKPG